MKIYNGPALASAAVSAHPARPATSLVHDSANARVVLFRLDPGQEVAVHTSPSSVLLTVLTGSGFVTGANGERDVKEGDIVAYDEREPHGMRAATEQLVIAAVIAPRPGSV
jgi:quercetin dioxygenase-like cupin family protein